MARVTTLEQKVVENIAQNEYADGNPEAGCWSWAIAEHGPHKINKKQVSGVMSSLRKKGLTWSNGESVGLTKAGLDYFNAVQSFKEEAPAPQPEKKAQPARKNDARYVYLVEIPGSFPTVHSSAPKAIERARSISGDYAAQWTWVSWPENENPTSSNMTEHTGDDNAAARAMTYQGRWAITMETWGVRISKMLLD